MTEVLSSSVKSCMSTRKSKSFRSSVSFTQVEIREYPREAGDNPSVQSGPPLTLGWKHEKETQVAVDEFEESRPPRRSYDDLQLSHYQRQLRLLDHGVSKEEQRKAEQAAAKARRDRIDTSLQGPAREKIDEVLQSARRKFVRLIRRPRELEQMMMIAHAEKVCHKGDALRKTLCTDRLKDNLRTDGLEDSLRTNPLSDSSDDETYYE